MNPVIFKVVDIALNLVAVGLERAAVIDAVRAQEEAGKTPDEIADFLKSMRDEALAKAEQATRT
jgi:hypothetical protein